MENIHDVLNEFLRIEEQTKEIKPQVKPKFLVFSKEGWCWNMAAWLKEEGYEAVCYIHEEGFKHLGDGFVDKVDDAKEVLRGDKSREWIIVFDNIGLGGIADALRKQGWRVWGASRWADRLEKDREYGRYICELAGVPTPTTYTASSLTDAENYIRSRPQKYVLKPHDNKVVVYIAEGADDALAMLQYWRSLGLETMSVDIQDYIWGRNVDVEFWYNNGLYLLPPNYTVETKRFLPGDCGPTVGCMSSVVWTSLDNSRVISEVLLPIAKVVRRYRWTGPLSVNIIVEEETENLYVLEFTPRIGYNAYFCLKHLLPDGFADVIIRCTSPWETPEEFLPQRMVVTDNTQFSVGIEVSIPPYPFETADKRLMQRVYESTKGLPIFVEETYPAKVYLCDVYKEDGMIKVGGTNAIVAEIVSTDESVDAAYERCVKTFYQLHIPNKQARLFDAVSDFKKYYPVWVEKGIVGGIMESRSFLATP